MASFALVYLKYAISVEAAVKRQGANDITERSVFCDIAFYTEISRLYPMLHTLHRTDHDFNLSSFCWTRMLSTSYQRVTACTIILISFIRLKSLSKT